MLNDNKIDLLAIQELNIRDTDNDNILKIPQYTLVHDALRKKNGLTRSGFLIHDSLKYKVREDIFNQEEAHTALTIYITKKKLNIHAWYRQWQEVSKTGRIKYIGTISAQKSRITKTAQYIAKSLAETETIVLSDTNVNTSNLNSPESQKTSRDKQTSQVAQILSRSILQEGMVITNFKPTHKNITIDHIMTSAPIKITNITTINTHMSDHQLVCANRLTKEPVRRPRYTTTRAYHRINYQEMAEEINSDHRLQRAMQINDSDVIAQLIIEVIRDQIDKRAPKKRIQTTKQTTNMSNENKQIMRNRDSAWKEYTQNPSQDNLRGYQKTLRTRQKGH